ncbi:hypothetical protein [Enterococcus faecium]|uniref:hypothetical protein n=1 Tax=Enterococcus faecium TaxID=1352 RepID=UPI003F5278F3
MIDTIVSEPVGGAHRDPAAAIRALGDALDRALVDPAGLPADQLRKDRAQKFLTMGRL